MTTRADRRGFLRDLVTLPLIGGGVTLIGQPTGVAEPVSTDLMLEYVDWLGWERRRAIMETYGSGVCDSFLRRREHTYELCSRAFQWHNREWDAVKPSTRAALVLSTIGCDWKDPETVFSRS